MVSGLFMNGKNKSKKGRYFDVFGTILSMAKAGVKKARVNDEYELEALECCGDCGHPEGVRFKCQKCGEVNVSEGEIGEYDKNSPIFDPEMKLICDECGEQVENGI